MIIGAISSFTLSFVTRFDKTSDSAEPEEVCIRHDNCPHQRMWRERLVLKAQNRFDFKGHCHRLDRALDNHATR